jgi:sn-glycerol 3-phosphate transport system substrate-binding protein
MAEKYGIKVDADNYIPGIKNFYADSDGKMIGVPFNSSTCLMYANMDILKKVGIESVPKTYEEFEAMAPKIKAAGYIPLVQSHFPWIWTENFFSRHNLLMTDGNNGYDAVPTKTLFAETDAFVLHWKKVKEWYESGFYGYKGRAWGIKHKALCLNRVFEQKYLFAHSTFAVLRYFQNQYHCFLK